LSLSEKYEIYAKKVLDLLENHEIAQIDNRNETIRKSGMLKCKRIPFMLIVGEEEEKTAPFLSVMDKKER
jgi:threonyl-tRNA synthetase